jgi:hypothetical protein
MAVSVTHTFVSPVTDAGSADEVGPDEWNATHTVTLGTDKLLGRDTAGSGAVEEIGLTSPLAFDGAGNITASAADLLTAIKTVDGSGSGLDADTLDGTELTALLTEAEAAAAYQPLDADLTSWAGVTRAAGFDTFVATPSSANLISLVTGETGTGALVFADTPTLVAPLLGTPTSGALTNCTGLTSGGVAAATLVTAADTVASNDNDTTWPTTAAIIDYAQPLDADLTSWAGVTRASGFDTFAATPSSANLDSLVTDDTGSGALVFANTPTLVSPILGTPTSGTLSNCDAGSTTAKGVVELATAAETDLKTSTTLVPTPSALKNYSRGQIWGLTLSNNVGDAVNDIDIAVGVAAADATPYPLIENTTAGLTKRIDASWAVGDGNGGLDGTESSAGTPDTSTWYHVWLIMRSDTGVVDALFSESATSPTMPANYDYKRRIGSVYNGSGGDIRAFHQTGDVVYWPSPISERSDTADVAWALTTLTGIPLGITTQPIVHGLASNTTGASFAYVGDARATAASDGMILWWATGAQNGGSTITGGFWSNTSAQIHYRVEEGTTLASSSLVCNGYIDHRGRLF